jgi:hypothetical protein
MQGAAPPPPFPRSHRPTHGQELMAAELLLRRGGITYAFLADVILDTGAPTTDIHEHGDLAIPDVLLDSAGGSTRVRPGVLFRVTAEGTEVDGGFELPFRAARHGEKASGSLGLILRPIRRGLRCRARPHRVRPTVSAPARRAHATLAGEGHAMTRSALRFGHDAPQHARVRAGRAPAVGGAPR